MSEHADTADITFEALPDDLAATPLVPDSPVAMAESAAVFAPVLPPSPDVAVVPPENPDAYWLFDPTKRI